MASKEFRERIAFRLLKGLQPEEAEALRAIIEESPYVGKGSVSAYQCHNGVDFCNSFWVLKCKDQGQLIPRAIMRVGPIYKKLQ